MPTWFPGAAHPVGDLDEQLRAATEKKQALRKELRAEMQRRRRELQRDGEVAPQPSLALSAILLLLFFFTGYETHLPVEYWERQRHKQHLPKLPREVLKDKIDDLFLATDPFDVLELADPHGSPVHFLGAADPNSAQALRLSKTRRFARQRAAAFLTKMRLRSWVETANASRGLAPSTTLLIEHYNLERHKLPEGVRPAALEDPATSVYARVFARRWRQLIGGKVGKLRVQDYISLEDKRAKARFHKSKFMSLALLLLKFSVFGSHS